MDLFDGHIHSIYSLDGKMTFEEIIQKSPCKVMSITDHDTLSGYEDFFKFRGITPDKSLIIREDSKVIIPGVEVTCRIPDFMRKDGKRTLKIHMLVYMPDYNSDFNELLKLKYQHDQLYEYGLIYHLSNKFNFSFTKEQIQQFTIDQQKTDPNFQSIGKRSILKFLDYIKYDYSTHTKQLAEAIASFDPNLIETFDLNAYDIIKLANSAGGFCIVAHPEKNLIEAQESNVEKIIKLLIDKGVSGFEIDSAANSEKFKKTLIKVSKQNKRPIIFTGGSDTHIISKKTRIGFSKNSKLELSNYKMFYKLAKIISKRNQGHSLSKEELSFVDKCINPRNCKTDTKAILDSYKNKYKQIVEKFYMMVSLNCTNRNKISSIEEKITKKFFTKTQLNHLKIEKELEKVFSQNNEDNDELSL